MSELKLLIRKSTLTQEAIQVPASKSYTHRALIAAALANGKTTIKNVLISDDTAATIEAIKQLGAVVKNIGDDIEVDGSKTLSGSANIHIDCRESGTTLRLLIPICALSNASITLTGKKGLMKRPRGEIVNSLSAVGANIRDENGLPPVRTN